MDKLIHIPVETYDYWEFLYSKRLIAITGEIDQTTKEEIVGKLYLLSALDNKAPISMLISSPGGEIYEGMAIINAINAIPNPVIGIASGHVMSMATVILCACDKRVSYPLTYFMYHQSQIGGFAGDSDQIKREADHVKALERDLNSIVAKACNKSINKVIKDFTKERYLNANEAMKYGFIQEILTGTKKYDITE